MLIFCIMSLVHHLQHRKNMNVIYKLYWFAQCYVNCQVFQAMWLAISLIFYFYLDSQVLKCLLVPFKKKTIESAQKNVPSGCLGQVDFEVRHVHRNFLTWPMGYDSGKSRLSMIDCMPCWTNVHTRQCFYWQLSFNGHLSKMDTWGWSLLFFSHFSVNILSISLTPL